MLQSKITKDEINAMPVVAFRGIITLVDNLQKLKPALDELKRASMVGFDTETKPTFMRGMQHKVSLLQLSTAEHCFLFRLNFIQFPRELVDFLSDSSITKIGLSLRDDLSGLARHSVFKPGGFIDLQNIAREYGILELSLQKIYAILFGEKISKSQRLTNWENNELSEQQQLYAATDAWACLKIYEKLQNEKKLPRKQVERLMQNAALELKQQQARRESEKQNNASEQNANAH